MRFKLGATVTAQQAWTLGPVWFRLVGQGSSAWFRLVGRKEEEEEDFSYSMIL